MSAEARYFRVGMFVFAGAFLIGSCAVVLGGRDLFRDKTLVESYFDESVDGLDVGSAVKYRGVRIGAVSKIAMVEDVYELDSAEDRLKYGQRVYVLMDLSPEGADEDLEEEQRRVDAMIERGLRFRLASQGVTGLRFLEADYQASETRTQPMDIVWTPQHTYVPSAPSTMRAITTAAERIFSRLEAVEVDKVVGNLDQLIVSLTAKVEEIEPGEVQREATALLSDLRATVVRARRMIDGGQYDLQVSLENLRVASENMREVTETARTYPSLLLLGQPPGPSEVSAK